VFVLHIGGFWGAWKYPELGTNALDRRGAVLLREKTKMHSMSHSDQRGMKAALGSPELTPREAEVLFWISQGKSNHDIGVILGAKTGTICKHVGHILSKLGVENRTSAAVVALEKRSSVSEKSKDRFDKPWIAVAGVIATQLGELLSGGCEIFGVLLLAG
jgi:DNA-binding CsgD family transcriptional regulator